MGVMVDGEAADRPAAVLIAVADELVDDLIEAGLGGEFPGPRYSIMDTVLTVGSSAMTVVTLHHAPAKVRALASWLRERASRTTIEVNDVRRGVTFTVRGPADSADAVAAFVAAALGDQIGSTAEERPRVFVCY